MHAAVAAAGRHGSNSGVDWRRYIPLYILPVIGTKKIRKITAADIERTVRAVPEIGKARRDARVAEWERKRREKEEARARKLRAYAAAGRKPPGPQRTTKPAPKREPRRPKTWKPTQAIVFAILSAALSSAERSGIIGRNPCANVEYRGQTTKRRVKIKWSLDDLRLFCKAAEDLRLGTLFILAAFTGMRRGELCGLRWIDIQLDLGWHIDTTSPHYRAEDDIGVLYVRKQRYVADHEVGEGDVKTEAGEDRPIVLDSSMAYLLRVVRTLQDTEHRALADTWVDSGRVFTKENGQPYHPQYVTRTFGKLLDRLGLPYTTLHGLRHLSVGLGAEAGETLLETSRRLGHSSISVTANMYGHIFEAQQRRSATARGKLLRDE